MEPYIPIAVLLLFVTVFAVAAVTVSVLLGIKRRNPANAERYESGIPAIGGPHPRFSVRYYLIGILFILFDVEIAFLYPWAVMQRRLGAAGLIEIAVFGAILGAGFIYAWRKGALEWREGEGNSER